jgi:hypothetical protein
MNLAQSQFLALLFFIRENAVFLVPPINLWSTLYLVKGKSIGWLVKFNIDIYYVYYFSKAYLENPNKESLALLLSMAIFLTAHGYGFIKWQFYNENKPTQANT